MGTSDILGGFSQPLSSRRVLRCAQTMQGCDLSSQDAFYCSPVQVDKNLAPELTS